MPLPWEIAKAAHDAEYALWAAEYSQSDRGFTNCWISRDGCGQVVIEAEYEAAAKIEFEHRRDAASWRAAIRALAGMHPTQAMHKEWQRIEEHCAVHNYGGSADPEELFQAGLNTAAAEGEIQ